MRDKISKDITLPNAGSIAKGSAAVTAKGGKNLSEATEALMVLGYDKNTIINALKDIDTNIDVGEIIRMALKKLSR